MMKTRIQTLLLSALSVFLTLSCSPEEVQTKYAAQEKNIENFVSSQQKSKPDMRAVYNNGVVRLVVAEGEQGGDELREGGTLSMLYAAYDFSSGSISNTGLIATNSADVASAAGWELTGKTYGPMTLTLDSSLLEGLQLGLQGVKRGEECIILFSGKHAHGRISVGTIPAYAPLAYQIWVQDIENN